MTTLCVIVTLFSQFSFTLHDPLEQPPYLSRAWVVKDAAAAHDKLKSKLKVVAAEKVGSFSLLAKSLNLKVWRLLLIFDI